MVSSDSVRGEMRRNFFFYITVAIFFAVGAILNRVFFTPVWTIIVPGVEIFIGIPSLIAVFFMFRVLSRIPKGSVERTILIFVGLTALSLAIAGIAMGTIEWARGQEAFTSSDFNIANIAVIGAFTITAIAGLTAVIILILNSYRILTGKQLIITFAVAALIFVGCGLVFFKAVSGSQLEGPIKIAAIFFSTVCFLSLVGLTFAVMAFGRGRGRHYWVNMTIGLMVIALSGLAVFFCYGTNGKWVGLALLGFCVGGAFLGFAGYQRWRMSKTL